jgi:hypothetical protein
MRFHLIFLAALTASSAHAQWGGFLDPNIIREAGSAAASGNLRMNNIELDNVQTGGTRGAPAPSAEDIAREIRRQQADESARAARQRLSEMQGRVRSQIATQYHSEFGDR